MAAQPNLRLVKPTASTPARSGMGLVRSGHAAALFASACTAAENGRKLVTVLLALASLVEFTAWLGLRLALVATRAVIVTASLTATALARLTGAALTRTKGDGEDGADDRQPSAAHTVASAARSAFATFRNRRRARRATRQAQMCGCGHPLAVHTPDLGCWMCSCAQLGARPELAEARTPLALPAAATTTRQEDRS